MTSDRIGRLLQAGVLTASACLAIGLVLSFVGPAGVANAVLAAGLLMLMATPVMPVLISLVTYLRSREWVFVWATVAVLGLLVVTLWLALTEAARTLR